MSDFLDNMTGKRDQLPCICSAQVFSIFHSSIIVFSFLKNDFYFSFQPSCDDLHSQTQSCLFLTNHHVTTLTVRNPTPSPCRSLVPKCDIQVLNGLPPKPSTKTKHWNQAMFELKKYGENIEAMRDNLGSKDKSLKVLMKSKAGKGSPQLGKVVSSSSSSSSQQHNSAAGHKKDGSGLSNHAPPVVEVTAASDSGADGTGSLSDVDISSPGTPPSLQIDLGGGGGGAGMQEKSPSKGRAMPSGGRGLIPSRNSQVPVSLDFSSDSNGGGAQSVVVRSPGGGSKVKKRGNPGAALQALVSTLAQRKRVAEQVGGSTAMMPVHQGAAIGPGAGAGQQQQQEDGGEGGGGGAVARVVGESLVKNDSPFSSIYEHEKKTAFALVDPNQKRTKRKTPKAAAGGVAGGGGGASSSEGPPAKKARLNTGSEAGGKGAGLAVGGDPDPVSLNDPAALAAKVQEFGNAALHALSGSGGGSVTTTPTPLQSVASLKANASNVRSSLSASPQNTSGSSSHSGSGPAPALPGLPKARASGGKKKGGGKKGGDKARAGKSPYKKVSATATSTATATAASNRGASATLSSTASQQMVGVSPSLAALIAAPTNTSMAGGGGGGGAGGVVASSSATATVSSEAGSSAQAEFMRQVTQGASSSHAGPSSSSSGGNSGGGGAPGEVRGEVAAPGIAGEDGAADFAEGSGLLADTIRKVNTSFMARVNQITGPSDDMGYKYFVEKVRERGET